MTDFEDGQLVHGDNLEWMKSQPDDSVDLIFCSPPYEDARTYSICFDLKGQDWVDWMVERWVEMQRICRGLVAMVVEGRTSDFQWTASPALLMAALHRAGLKLRKPPIYQRYGIPGTGGPDWLRNDYEFIICSSKGKLPWSDNTACGHPAKHLPGGAMSHRTEDGKRIDGNRVHYNKSHALANPGNIIDCGAVGGGSMGCDIAHEGEAPFPEKLVQVFVKSFCPKDGVVLDPFVGTGTTISVARQNRRRFIGIDIRESEIEKSTRRLGNAALRQGFDL